MRHGLVRLWLLLLGLTGCAGRAGAPARATPPLPFQASAHWIGTAEHSAPNTWLAFRHTFEIDQIPVAAATRVAVDSKYWLWVNGMLAVREGGLSRGPTPTGTYYDQLDLTPFLHKGRNTVAVLVWYFGRSGRYHVSSGRAGLLFEMAGPVASDAGWKVLRHPAFSDTSPPAAEEFVPPPGVRFDARKDIPGWTSPAFDDSAWSTAVDFGPPATAPWNELVARPIPQWRDFGLREYVQTKTEIRGDGTQVLRARLPYNAQVTPWIELEGAAGSVVDLRTDHFETPGGPGDNNHYFNVRAEYVTSHGVQAFEAPSWMSGEEVLYSLPADVKVRAVRFRETGYDTDPAGAFTSSDPRLTKLWEKARRTLYLNVRDIYMDCPDRERGQWIGDAAIEVPQTFYAFDRRIDALTRKLLNEIVGWRDKYGSVLTLVPGANAPELPSQGLHVISHQGIAWTLYEHTGDSAPLTSSLDPFARYLDLWKIGANGLVQPRAGAWAWFDHGEGIDVPVNENAWYHGALVSLADAARVARRHSAEKDLRARAANLADAFERAFWRGDGYRSGQALDDRGNALAVTMGLAPEHRFPVIRDALTHVSQATPYMEKTVLEALFRMGYAREALERMRERYAPMIDAATTTLWEDFTGAGTLNHAWAGGPLYLLSRYVAGVAPVRPGYETFAVVPRPVDLAFVAATVPSIRGPIHMRLDSGPGRVQLQVTVPPRTSADLGLPLSEGRRPDVLFINGRPARTDALPHGLTARGLRDGALHFQAEPGTWVIEGRWRRQPSTAR